MKIFSEQHLLFLICRVIVMLTLSTQLQTMTALYSSSSSRIVFIFHYSCSSATADYAVMVSGCQSYKHLPPLLSSPTQIEVMIRRGWRNTLNPGKRQTKLQTNKGILIGIISHSSMTPFPYLSLFLGNP